MSEHDGQEESDTARSLLRVLCGMRAQPRKHHRRAHG
jgi:hypothetical protein